MFLNSLLELKQKSPPFTLPDPVNTTAQSPTIQQHQQQQRQQSTNGCFGSYDIRMVIMG